VTRPGNASTWSLAAQVRKAPRSYLSAFEKAVRAEAEAVGVDGVVCGHVHQPGIRQLEGITYANTGDWVEHCTALVEHLDGRLEVIGRCPVAQAVYRAERASTQ